MNLDWVRELCLSFPYATEQIAWGCDLTFRVGGKIFAVTVLEPARVWLSFKCSPENFAELTERNAIIPAPYLARAQWIALETKEALPPEELARLLRESYDLVVSKLSKKTRDALSRAPMPKRRGGKQKTSTQNPRSNNTPRKNTKKKSS